MEAGRKRIRSDDRIVRQNKYFVTETLVEKNDAVLMAEIYQKTLNLMFKGARNQNKVTEESRHENSLESDENDDEKLQDTLDDKLPNSVGDPCKLCLNGSGTSSRICFNCNLRVCFRCASDDNKCFYCQNILCVNCIKIFGCCFIDSNLETTPACEECKSYLD